MRFAKMLPHESRLKNLAIKKEIPTVAEIVRAKDEVINEPALYNLFFSVANLAKGFENTFERNGEKSIIPRVEQKERIKP